jgi:hypothetical protein
MQNEQTLQQMIREYEANMPPEIMNLIKSFDWKKEVRTIVNQNQLMIDVGSDLEESIYLMLLGVTKVADLYERLVEEHQIPDDKAQKIIQEIEVQIFNPLYKKMMELDGKDSPATASAKAPATPRDEILAEIEKEPEVLIKFNTTPKESTSIPKQEASPVSDPGITKPFTVSAGTTMQVEAEKIAAPASTMPTQPVETVVPAQGVQENPIAAALTKPTATANPSAKPYSADPYREPIE